MKVQDKNRKQARERRVAHSNPLWLEWEIAPPAVKPQNPQPSDNKSINPSFSMQLNSADSLSWI
jgi:hypothetical protein